MLVLIVSYFVLLILCLTKLFLWKNIPLDKTDYCIILLVFLYVSWHLSLLKYLSQIEHTLSKFKTKMSSYLVTLHVDIFSCYTQWVIQVITPFMLVSNKCLMSYPCGTWNGKPQHTQDRETDGNEEGERRRTTLQLTMH